MIHTDGRPTVANYRAPRTEADVIASAEELRQLGKDQLVELVMTLRGDILVAEAMNEVLERDVVRKQSLIEQLQEEA